MMTARTAWSVLTESEQYRLLRRFAASLPKRDRYGLASWMKDGSETWEDALDTVVGGAWLRLEDAFDRAEAEGKPLAWALSVAVDRAAAKHKRMLHPGRGTRCGENAAFEDVDYRAAVRMPDPEMTTILRDLLARLLADPKNKVIVEARAAGYTLKRIGGAVGMSHAAVIKRLKVLRNRAEAPPPSQYFHRWRKKRMQKEFVTLWLTKDELAQAAGAVNRITNGLMVGPFGWDRSHYDTPEKAVQFMDEYFEAVGGALSFADMVSGLVYRALEDDVLIVAEGVK